MVLDRIYKDFSGLDIFFQDPVLPDHRELLLMPIHFPVSLSLRSAVVMSTVTM